MASLVTDENRYKALAKTTTINLGGTPQTVTIKEAFDTLNGFLEETPEKIDTIKYIIGTGTGASLPDYADVNPEWNPVNEKTYLSQHKPEPVKKLLSLNERITIDVNTVEGANKVYAEATVRELIIMLITNLTHNSQKAAQDFILHQYNKDPRNTPVHGIGEPPAPSGFDMSILNPVGRGADEMLSADHIIDSWY